MKIIKLFFGFMGNFFLYLNMIKFGHRTARHIAFHRKYRYFKLISVSESIDYSDSIWEIRHKQTCEICKYSKIHGISRLKKSSFSPSGLGYAEAVDYAKNYQGGEK